MSARKLTRISAFELETPEGDTYKVENAAYFEFGPTHVIFYSADEEMIAAIRSEDVATLTQLPAKTDNPTLPVGVDQWTYDMVTLPPEAWQELFGVVIMDPDGWGEDRSWDEWIGKKEFELRALNSTVYYKQGRANAPLLTDLWDGGQIG